MDWMNSVMSSSVARGGGGGGSSPPHWLVKYAKSHVFCAFEADFLWKIENSPPHAKRAPPETFEVAKLLKKNRLEFWRRPFFFFIYFFFFGDHLILGGKNVWILDFGRKMTLNFGEDLFFFFFFFFFGDHLILGGKNVWILDFGRKITLNFGEDLFFFFFFFFFFGDHLKFGGKNVWIFDLFETIRLKFWQTVWNWFRVNENSSQGRLHTSHSFKIAPPFSKSWLRAWSCQISFGRLGNSLTMSCNYLKQVLQLFFVSSKAATVCLNESNTSLCCIAYYFQLMHS